MLKTLKLDTLYSTPTIVTVTTTLADLFDPKTTFFIKLLDHTWVMYQLHNKEMVKADSLHALLKKTFKMDVAMFYGIATEMNEQEKQVIEDIFNINDNFNISKDSMYKLI